MRGLDRHIREVVKVEPGVKPLECFRPVAGPQWPGGEAALKSPAGKDGPPPVDSIIVERLMTVLAALRLSDDASVNVAMGDVTIRQFREWSQTEQLKFINTAWNAITSTHEFRTKLADMFDPVDGTMEGLEPLPTSWCPTRPGASVYHKRLSGTPFKEFGIGFRVDGSEQSSVDRVLRDGMTQQRLNDSFMRDVRGQILTGTVAYDASTARVWTLSNDIFSETAVCVSRNFFGATAFPERETKHSGAEFSALWAVDCTDLLGFDTERHQIGLPGSQHWRPGEKAFSSIPKKNLIGWVKIQRRGAPKKGGWRVDVPMDAKWNFTGSPSVAQRTYLVGELEAWRGQHEIPAGFDFAT